jgi:hypothetical protein
MASTVVQPIADSIAAIIDALTFDPPVKAYATPPPMLEGHGPFAVVEFPTLHRRQLNDGETEIGSNDWFPTYPVVLYVDLKVARRDSERVIALVEQFVLAIDANPGLNNDTVDDSVVTTSDPFIYVENKRPFLAYECEVQVYKRVPTTP